MKLSTIPRIALSLVALTAPLVVGAALPTKPPGSILSTEGEGGITTLIGKAGGWFFGILLALAVVFILYAAYLFLTSGGDEEKVKTARKFLVYAVVAVAVAILAAGIVALTKTFLTGEAPPRGGNGRGGERECTGDADCVALYGPGYACNSFNGQCGWSGD